MRTSHLAIAAALAATLALTTAGASGGDIPIARRSAAGADIWWWSARGQGSVFPIVGFFNYELTNDVFLDIRLPLAPWFRNEARFGMGNPHGGVRYAPVALGGKLTWFVGGRAGIPLADIDDADWQASNVQALLALAAYDSHYWAPYLPLSAMGGVELRPIDMLWLRATGDLLFFLPLRSSRDFEVVWQNRFEAELQNDAGVGGGLGLQGVAATTNDAVAGDGVQIAAEPYFTYDNNRFLLRAGILIALDRPLGFGFQRGKVLSPHVQIGGHF